MKFARKLTTAQKRAIAPSNNARSGYGNFAANNADNYGRGHSGSPPKFVVGQNTQASPQSGHGLPRDLPFVVRKHALALPAPLAIIGPGGLTGPDALPVSFFVHTPSNRLRLAIYVAFEAQDTEAVTPLFVAGLEPSWVVRSFSKNPISGKDSVLQQAYPEDITTVAPLPDSYEVDTAATLLRAEVSIFPDSIDPAWTTATINVIGYATWEPNTPISETELKWIYNNCAITGPDSSLAIENMPPT